MEKTDRLSWRPDWQKGAENNNKDQTFIKPEWIKRTEILVEEDDLRRKIRKVQKRDKKVVKIVKKLKKTRIKTLENEE